MELFIRGMDNALWHRAQAVPSGGWLDWEPLGGSWRGNPVVARNADGRLEVFIRGGTFDTVHHIWQLRSNGRTRADWSGWEDLGNRRDDRPAPGSGPRIFGDPAVGQNADGRLEVFARLWSADSGLLHIWQVRPNGTWSNWEGIGQGEVDGQPVVGRNADGRLEVFYPGHDHQGRNGLLHVWQVRPNGTWSAPHNLGHGHLVSLTDRPTADLAVGKNADGRLEVFWRGLDNRVYHVWHDGSPDDGWSGLAELPAGGLALGPPVVVSDAIGRLQVFIIGLDNALWNNLQTGQAPLFWTGWATLFGGSITDQAIGMNADGRLEAFVRTSDNNLWHKWQTRRP
jgi:hypothetical protein